MMSHTKIYLKYFGYNESDFIPCENCGAKSVDIHHIERRGMGGTNNKNDISNLMALCRKCHIELGDKKQFKQYLLDKHYKIIKQNENSNRIRGLS